MDHEPTRPTLVDIVADGIAVFIGSSIVFFVIFLICGLVIREIQRIDGIPLDIAYFALLLSPVFAFATAVFKVVKMIRQK